MSSRFQRPTGRAPVAPVHRGPQAAPLGASSAPAPYGAYNIHAPNAALLIDFDNVTMGIQKDMQGELRNLMSSDIIKGKVSVQRAYADWRRYPGYIVPLTEASIDLIFAPAYGSAKKNATDIRLAIDAMELVFTRPEIGTFILLSGDSDFSSLVIKLKEYGKYVIGVGIRESSSDLLVQNCDEYYSYNALAGLVRAGDEEVVRWDPWELVGEAVTRMTRNGDVMRADRLKQVMQDIDPAFDEKDLGMSKFSRFVHEAEKRRLLTLTRLDNGQYEIGAMTAGAVAPAEPASAPDRARRPEPTEELGTETAEAREAREGRGPRDERGRPRRGRRGRGRDFDRPRSDVENLLDGVEPTFEDLPSVGGVADRETLGAETGVLPAPVVLPPVPAIGVSGERLTRGEAFDLVRRAVESLVQGDDDSVSTPQVRERARELLTRDSESLNERMFERILRDAHDAELIDLRRRGDIYEVGRAAQAESVADQLNRAASAQTGPTVTATTAPAAPRGMGPRGGLQAGRRGGRPGAPPADLLSVGVVRVDAPAAASAPAAEEASEPEPIAAAELEPIESSAAPQPTVALEDGGSTASPGGPPATSRGRSGRGRGGRSGAAKGAGTRAEASTSAAPASPAPAPVAAPAAAPATPTVAPEAPAAPRGGRGRGGARKSAASAPAAKTAPVRARPAAAPAAGPVAPAAPPASPAAARGGRGRAPGRAAAKTAPEAPIAPAAPPAAAAAATDGAAARRPRRARARSGPRRPE